VNHGQDALLVPAKDPEAIADAVHKIIQDPELVDSLAVRAGMKVRSKYGSNLMAQKYNSLYSEVL